MPVISQLAVSGYRSLRDIKLLLAPLTIITGANETGKSSVYRALRLLADMAQGRLINSLAREGGMHSTLWAGPERISQDMRTGKVPIQGPARRALPARRRSPGASGLASRQFGPATSPARQQGSHVGCHPSAGPTHRRSCGVDPTSAPQSPHQPRNAQPLPGMLRLTPHATLHGREHPANRDVPSVPTSCPASQLNHIPPTNEIPKSSDAVRL